MAKAKSIGARNRRKGHNAERFYATKFKEMGFDKCVTARYGSHLLDDCKVDLMFLPINVQIKAGYAKGFNYGNTLSEMESSIQKTYPAHTVEYNAPNIIIHHKDVGAGNSRKPEHSLVVMTFDTFISIFQKAYLENTKKIAQ